MDYVKTSENLDDVKDSFLKLVAGLNLIRMEDYKYGSRKRRKKKPTHQGRHFLSRQVLPVTPAQYRRLHLGRMKK